MWDSSLPSSRFSHILPVLMHPRLWTQALTDFVIRVKLFYFVSYVATLDLLMAFLWVCFISPFLEIILVFYPFLWIFIMKIILGWEKLGVSIWKVRHFVTFTVTARPVLLLFTTFSSPWHPKFYPVSLNGTVSKNSYIVVHIPMSFFKQFLTFI